MTHLCPVCGEPITGMQQDVQTVFDGNMMPFVVPGMAWYEPCGCPMERPLPKPHYDPPAITSAELVLEKLVALEQRVAVLERNDQEDRWLAMGDDL